MNFIKHFNVNFEQHLSLIITKRHPTVIKRTQSLRTEYMKRSKVGDVQKNYFLIEVPENAERRINNNNYHWNWDIANSFYD